MLIIITIIIIINSAFARHAHAQVARKIILLVIQTVAQLRKRDYIMYLLQVYPVSCNNYPINLHKHNK